VPRMLDGRWRTSEYLDGTVGAEDRVLLEEHLGALPALLRRAGVRPVAQRSHNEQTQPGSWFAPDPRAFANLATAPGSDEELRGAAVWNSCIVMAKAVGAAVVSGPLACRPQQALTGIPSECRVHARKQ
jgi:hypothetical protein